jgi:hypothetical protein
LEVIAEIVAALSAHVTLRVVYQGEGLDRLRDQRHAELVEEIVGSLRDLGWEVATEVSFNSYGERGSIDILAFHPPTRTLLVIEVKSVVPDLGGMLATLDRKVRLAPKIAADRGWEADTVARLLVLPETSTCRRRVAQHEATFANAFPARNVEVNAWLRQPKGGLSGLLFLSSARGASHRRVSAHSARPARRRPRTGDD